MKLRTWCIRIGHILTKTVLVFTGFLVFLTLFCPQLTKAENDRGGITIRQQNVPIEKVFQSIEKQSGYRFFYNETLLQGAGKVTLNLQNASLQQALDACFRNQPLSYAIVEKTIIVKKRPEQQTAAPIATAAITFSKPGKIIAVRGKVTSGNTPIVGASIMIKGTDNGASTDKDGMFTLPEVEDDATLVISSVSHAMREVSLNGQTYIAIDLSKQTDDLDEAVVVAYNTTTRRMNTGSVTVVKGEEIQTLPNRSFDKSLQGLVPGLLVTQGTGQPGGGTSNFVLRGIATGGNPIDGSTVRNPLIVIDGVPVYQDPAQAVTSAITFNNPMAQLNPSDIETITVLKDAAAIALYGSRASNGVIIVTTKKGKSGKTILGLRHQTDISSRLRGNAKSLNQEQYLELLYETYKNTDPVYWTDSRIKTDLISKFPYLVNSPGDSSFYSAPNWLNELYNNNATTISNELSMSGGNDRSNFYVNLEWTKQDGIEKKSGYDRKSLRFNYENRPLSWLKIGLNSSMSYNIQNYNLEGLSESAVLNISPLNPIRQSNGDYYYNYTWGFGPSSSATSAGYKPNPLASSDLNLSRNVSYRGLSKLYGELKVLKYFTLNSNVGVDFMMTEAKEKVHPLLASSSLSPGIGRILQSDIRNANFITTNLLRFDFQKNNHGINALIGQEAQILTRKNSYIERQNISNSPLANQASDGTLYNAYGSTNKQTLVSYFGQVNYSFLNRYFLSGSTRRDGSSLFGENKRFGSHWSTGIGWLISGEPFLESTNKWLDYFKIRGSIGSAGNSSAISSYLRYDQIALSSYLGNPAILPDQNGSPGNPGIQWEKTFNWDAGLELKLFQERIGFVADIYTRKTSDVIAAVNLPYATGFTNLVDNIGDIKNKGVELSLSADIWRSKNFRWHINANWSKNQNVLIRSFLPLEKLGGTLLANGAGKNYNSFYIPTWAGVDPQTGKPQWIDSADKVTTNYATAKPDFVGKPQPDGFGSFTSSFNYKGIELSASFYYQYGFQIYTNTGRPVVNDGTDPFINQSTEALNRWQKPGDIAANPRRLLFGRFNNVSDGGTSFSTRYLMDGDFIRLANVILAYNLPRAVLNRLKISNLRVFVQGHNLATWTKYSGQDPEGSSALGQAGSVYPIQRSYSFGVNVNF